MSARACSASGTVMRMVQRWYQKATVQAAGMGGACVILAAVLGVVLSPENRRQEKLPVQRIHVAVEEDGSIAQHWEHLKYSFSRPEYVHPKIIDALHGAFADIDTSIVHVDLISGNDSNHFLGDVYVEDRANGETWVMSRGTSDIDLEEAYCGYRYVGTSDSGIHVLHAEHCPGGTAVLESLLLVTLRTDQAIDLGFDDSPKLRSRVLLAHVGTIAIRRSVDREITFSNGRLAVQYGEDAWEVNSIVPISIEID